MSIMQEFLSGVKLSADITAVGTAAGTILQYLPAGAALFTMIWLSIRMYGIYRVVHMRKTCQIENCPAICQWGCRQYDKEAVITFTNRTNRTGEANENMVGK